jgi:Kazal-type serine protease inhibitor domain
LAAPEKYCQPSVVVYLCGARIVLKKKLEVPMNRLTIASFGLAALFSIGAVFATAPAQAAAKCPRIFLPVCGFKDGAKATYNNACLARQAHARILHRGECQGGQGPICTFIFLPVCALDPQTRKPNTYPNLCVAENAGAQLIHNGACKTKAQ